MAAGLDEAAGEGGGTGTHIAADDNGVGVFDVFCAAGFAELGEVDAGGVADFPGGVFVEGIGVDSADVVGLEDLFEHERFCLSCL